MTTIRGSLRRWIVLVLIVGMAPWGHGTATAAGEEEIERFVRARIDLGEAMRDFFRQQGGAPFGSGSERPSMEEMRKLEEEINAMVAEILTRHDLTIEEYQERSPEVFADTKGVERFLEKHSDLKSRYEALPTSPSRGRQ